MITALSASIVVGILAVLRRAGARRPHEQGATVGEGNVAPVGAHASVLRLVARDDDDRADLDRIARDAVALQRVRRAASTIQIFALAVGGLVLHVDPRVRIDPLDLGYRALQGHRRVGVEFRRERVMGKDRDSCRERDESGAGDPGFVRHERRSPVGRRIT